jgi:hypothetical protein
MKTRPGHHRYPAARDRLSHASGQPPTTVTERTSARTGSAPQKSGRHQDCGWQSPTPCCPQSAHTQPAQCMLSSCCSQGSVRGCMQAVIVRSPRLDAGCSAWECDRSKRQPISLSTGLGLAPTPPPARDCTKAEPWSSGPMLRRSAGSGSCHMSRCPQGRCPEGRSGHPRHRLARGRRLKAGCPSPNRSVPSNGPPSAVCRGASAAATSPHALSSHPVTGKPLSDAPTVGSMTVRLMSDTSAEMNASCDASGPW